VIGCWDSHCSCRSHDPGLIAERQARRDEGHRPASPAGWGARQTLAEPYLVIPLRALVDRDHRARKCGKEEGHTRSARSASSAPSSTFKRLAAAGVDWKLDVAISEKARGIYKARLYVTSAEACWPPAGAGALRIAESDAKFRIRLDTPKLVLGHLRSARHPSVGKLLLEGRSYDFSPGTTRQPAERHPRRAARSYSAQAADARALLSRSRWRRRGARAAAARRRHHGRDARRTGRNPSFQGDFLPPLPRAGRAGDSAHAGRSRIRRTRRRIASVPVLRAPACTAARAAPRSTASCSSPHFRRVLLFELLRALRSIRPVRPVGWRSRCSSAAHRAPEHIALRRRLAIRTFACVGLIAGYLVRVLQSARLGLAFGAALGALYAMLYALLQAEDYSLLGGALLLFALLARLWLRRGASTGTA